MDNSFDLDSLNLDDLLIELDIDTNIAKEEENLIEDTDKIEEPHIKVSTKDFKEFIKLAKYVITNNAKDIVSKSVALEVRDGKVIGYTTDHDVYLEYNMDILNTSNLLNEPVCFPIDSILKMLKALPSSTAIIKGDDGFKVKLVGGALPLETHSIDIESFKFKDEIKESDVPVVDAKVFNSILKYLGLIANTAVAVNERRVIFNEHGAYASYMFSMTKVIGSFPTMDIKIKDLTILKNITSNREGSLMFFDIADITKSKRKVIKSNKFSYAFLISDKGVNNTLLTMENNLSIDEGLYVDFNQLFKLVELSDELGYSVGKLGLNFTNDCQLELAFKTKKGKDSMFYISGTSNNNIKPLKKPLDIPSKFLKTLLMPFARATNVQISLMDKAIVVHFEDYRGILFLTN